MKNVTAVGVELREMTLWAGGESVEGNVSSCEVWEGRGKRGGKREEGREEEGRGRGGSDVGELADSTVG